MDISEVWPLLKPATRAWLIEHNGEPLAPEIAAEIAAEIAPEIAAPHGAASPSPIEESVDGPLLTDGAVDWIETVANDE
jgi:hypothetical protein